MILLLAAHQYDPTIVRLSEHLATYQADHLVLEVAAMSEGNILLEPGPGRGEAVLNLDFTSVRFADVRSAFLWRSWPGDLQDPAITDRFSNLDEWNFYAMQWSMLSKGLRLGLEQQGVFCVNPPQQNTGWQDKIGQLIVASQIGLVTPETLFAVNMGDAVEFARRHNDDVIYKPFDPYFRVDAEHEQVALLYTNRLTTEEIAANSTDLLPTPGIFQPYVKKAYELRVVMVGDTIFCCRIDSQQSEIANEDWRRYDGENAPHSTHQLPAEIQKKCLDLMAKMGLRFGSIDFIVTPEDDHVFLEVNPVGQFDWVAHTTGMPIYDRLAKLLIEQR